MMKKIIVFVLAVLMVLGLTACKPDEPEIVPEKHTITFVDMNGNERLKTQVYNEEIELPEAPKVKGYQFIGWYLESENPTTAIDSNYFVSNPATQDVTVYACYVESSEFKATPSSVSGCAITGIIGKMTDVKIPEKITINVGGEDKEYVVEAILDRAFEGNTDIVSIYIPDTVKKIGNAAFKGCTNLKEIKVPTTVNNEKDPVFHNYVNIGDEILTDTPALTTITAPIWIVEFANCQNLVDVTLTAGDTIKAGMFENAKNLKSVILNSDLEMIASKAFFGASALTKIAIPANVSAIASDAFAYCGSLASIEVDVANTTFTSNGSNCIVDIAEKTLIAGCANTTIYRGVNLIGDYAFVGCKNLKALSIPSTVNAIAEGAFYGCTSLEKIEVDAGNGRYKSVNNCLIFTYEQRLILGCKNSVITEDMLSVVVNNDVEYIPTISNQAFAGCIGLKEIYIPSSVVALEADTFAGCTALNKIVIANDELVFDGDVFSSCPAIKEIKIPMHLLSYFVEKSKNVLTSVTLTTGKSLDEGIFEGAASLTTIHLPASLTEIGAYAFSGAKKLENIVLAPESQLAVIGHNAFDGCIAFTAIKVENVEEPEALVIPATVAFIGDYAFRGCAFDSLAFEKEGALRDLGYKVFADCVSLTVIDIPAFLTSVDFDAFSGCSALAVAYIPADFIRALAGAKADGEAPILHTLNITSGTVVDCYYIREMTSLTTLVIGASVEFIDNRAFEGCAYLTDVEVDPENAIYYSESGCIIEKDTGKLVLGTCNAVIPESVKTIASYAFACSSIEKIVIPANVELIERFAFSSCRSLAEITIESENTAIETCAFDGSDGVVKATIPANAIPYISQASLVTVEITKGDEIPAYAFKDCVTLKTVIVNPEVLAVGEMAFGGCSNITAITAPASILLGFSELNLEALGINKTDLPLSKEFIDNFKDMTSLYLLESDEEYEIADDAFKSCTKIEIANVPAWAIAKIPTDSLKKLIINSGSTVGGKVVFPVLEEVSFAASVTEIDASVFKASSTLKVITVAEANEKFTVSGNCLLDGTTIVLGALGFQMPEGITAIGSYAFAGRTDIPTIDLYEGIVSIGDYAFADCTALVIKSFPETLESIGAYAFHNCQSITAVILPESVTVIGDYAFAGCIAVTEVKLPAAIAKENVGKGIFKDCENITTASVPTFAFNLLPIANITTLEVVAGETLAKDSLKGFTSLTTLIIGKTVSSIVPTAINGENKLTSIVVSEENETYKSIDNCIISADAHLVMGCSTSKIPADAGILYIDEHAFRNCKGLTSVVIPATVIEISPLAFEGCKALESISVAEGNETYYSENNSVIKTETEIDTETETETVNKVLVLGCVSSVIPADVTVIGDYAFYNITALSAIEIPASVTTIGKNAFAYTGLVEVRIPAGVVAISDSAFYGCTALKNVIVAENSKLETIGAKAFNGCSNLDSIVIPTSVTSIATDAFVANGVGMIVYWGGASEADWNSVDSAVKSALASAKIYYYSLSYKDEASNKFWKYDEMDGSINVWN